MLIYQRVPWGKTNLWTQILHWADPIRKAKDAKGPAQSCTIDHLWAVGFFSFFLTFCKSRSLVLICVDTSTVLHVPTYPSIPSIPTIYYHTHYLHLFTIYNIYILYECVYLSVQSIRSSTLAVNHSAPRAPRLVRSQSLRSPREPRCQGTPCQPRTRCPLEISWCIQDQTSLLVGGIPTPLKNMSSSIGMIIPNICKK